MSILLDTLRKYPHLFVNNDKIVLDGRLCNILTNNLSDCNNCVLHVPEHRCLGYYKDNPNLPADLAELQQSNPELFI